jgi:hypothetical protein
MNRNTISFALVVGKASQNEIVSFGSLKLLANKIEGFFVLVHYCMNGSDGGGGAWEEEGIWELCRKRC